jgi:hypothetical protein
MPSRYTLEFHTLRLRAAAPAVASSHFESKGARKLSRMVETVAAQAWRAERHCCARAARKTRQMNSSAACSKLIDEQLIGAASSSFDEAAVPL